MTKPGSDDRSDRDAAALAPYFAAARRSEPEPSLRLLSAILADAGEVAAARAAPPAQAARRAPPRRGLFAALGGWRVATALVAASIVGFSVGLSGAVDLSGGTGWTTATTTAAAESQDDPVAGFFDLASAE